MDLDGWRKRSFLGDERLELLEEVENLFSLDVDVSSSFVEEESFYRESWSLLEMCRRL